MAEDPIKKAKETADIVEDAFRSIAASVKDIFNEALDASDDFGKTLSKDITRNINSIARSSSQLVSNQMKIVDGSLKLSDIEKQRVANLAKIEGIERQIKVANASTSLSKKEKLKYQKALNKQLENAIESNAEITNQLNEQENTLKEINKLSGAYEDLAEGIKSIPGLGPILKGPFEGMAKGAKQTATALATGTKTAGIFGKGMTVAGGAFKGLASGVGKSVMRGGPFGVLLLIAQKFVEALIMADKQSTAISRSLGSSTKGAEIVRDAMISVSNSTKSTAVTLQNTLDTLFKVNSILGVSTAATTDLSRIEKERLGTLTDINERLGLSEQSFTRLTRLSYLTGENADDILKGMIGVQSVIGLQNNTLFNSKEILEETLSLSDSIFLKFKFQTGEIAKAVAEAKLLGFSLKDIEGTQSSLLNFESSIASELEAELLTNKELNLERARFFALNDDLPALGKELEKQLGTLEEFQNLNNLQRTSFAKALGMDEAKVIEILTKQQELRNIQKLTADDEFKINAARILGLDKLDKLTKEQVQNLISSGELSDNQRKQIEEAFGASQFAMMKREDATKRFERALDRVQELFVKLVDGGLLDKLVKAIEEVALALSGDQSLFSILFQGVDKQIVAQQKQLQLEKERQELLKDEIKNKQKIENLDKQIQETREKEQNIAGKKTGTFTGIGAVVGGLLGAIFGGGVGAIPGAAIGATLFGGGRSVYEDYNNEPQMATGGIVNRPTRALIGEAGAEAVVPLNEFYAKIDQLIAAVESNRNVYMDGRLVGDAVAARSFK